MKSFGKMSIPDLGHEFSDNYLSLIYVYRHNNLTNILYSGLYYMDLSETNVPKKADVDYIRVVFNNKKIVHSCEAIQLCYFILLNCFKFNPFFLRQIINGPNPTTLFLPKTSSRCPEKISEFIIYFIKSLHFYLKCLQQQGPKLVLLKRRK